MNTDELNNIKAMAESYKVINALKNAIEERYWIKFSTPYCNPCEIYGGQLREIMKKHLNNAINEIEEYLNNVKVEGI